VLTKTEANGNISKVVDEINQIQRKKIKKVVDKSKKL
jgi:hypothetical protein